MRRIAPMLLAVALALSVLAFAPAVGEIEDTSGGEEATTTEETAAEDADPTAERVVTAALESPRLGVTERVSVASDGTEGNSISVHPSVSADGRFVAFHSDASNLVEDDSNNARDVFVHDRETGLTERVSVASDGSEGNSMSVYPSVSADGRFVAFHSDASNLVEDDSNEGGDVLVPGSKTGSDVFVHDRETGLTERVSVASDGTEGNSMSVHPSVSADGRFVAFHSDASNLVEDDSNNTWDVFVHDRETALTERVSVSSDGTEGNGFIVSAHELGWPSISADGRFVAFHSDAQNLVPGDTNGVVRGDDGWDVFVHDRETGLTERVSVSSDGSEGNAMSVSPSVSADGSHVAFWSVASNLVPGDTNGKDDVFIHDRRTGVTERVSVSSDGVEGTGPSNDPSISLDGRYVAFWSLASNLVPDDTNGATDVFVHDRETGSTERVSVASDALEGDARSLVPSISADARHVAFHSRASNLVSGDLNGLEDVFMRDRGPALGVGEFSTVRSRDLIAVSGWASFSGQAVASVDDPMDDGGPGAEDAGAELTGASLTFRPAHEDLLVRLRLASLPGAGVRVCSITCAGISTGAGAPAVLYGLRFKVGDIPYEVRGVRAGITTAPSTAPRFALSRCDPDCHEVARLTGGIGTIGSEVRVSLPLEALGVAQGASLTDVEGFASLGEAVRGGVATLDEVSLPDGIIPRTRVDVGIAPSASQLNEVSFAEADLLKGRFSGTVDVSSLAAGPHRLWVRACLGVVCDARWLGVTL